MKAEIITIGDEILLGQVVDTNSAWIAQQLNDINVPVVHITTISDTEEAILSALEAASKRARIVIVTGGLGPTKDDVTKQTAAKYFNTTLVKDSEVLFHVKGVFSKLGYQMPAINLTQAEVLLGCEILFNKVGTAPGMWMEKEGVYYVFVPGVPFEMKYLVENEVISRLEKLNNEFVYIHRYLVTVGVGESLVAERISGIEEALPENIKIAYLPKLGLVRLRVSAKGKDYAVLQREVDKVVKNLAEELKDCVIALDDVSFEEVLIREMTKSGVTLSMAESCTGGKIASELTAYSGASKILQGGIVAYANSAKESCLGVSSQTLKSYGAVSEEVVKEMAIGAKSRLQSDYAIATSGIAGPTGGTDQKPVGTVWIAVAGKSKVIARKYNFKNDRTINIERTVSNAFLMLWHLFKEEA